jgi:hypothetical protein
MAGGKTQTDPSEHPAGAEPKESLLGPGSIARKTLIPAETSTEGALALVDVAPIQPALAGADVELLDLVGRDPEPARRGGLGETVLLGVPGQPGGLLADPIR